MKSGASAPLILKESDQQPLGVQADLAAQATGDLQVGVIEKAVIDPNGSLEVDVSDEVTTIRTLRNAFALQAFLERTARGGSRYIEMLKSMFNVNSSDKRLQRPEFLGRHKGHMRISEVLSTVESASLPPGS